MPTTISWSAIVAVVPFVVTDVEPMKGETTSGGGGPMRNETDFSAEVLFLSVVIVTTHVYSPSARFAMLNEAVSAVWFWRAVTAAALLRE